MINAGRSQGLDLGWQMGRRAISMFRGQMSCSAAFDKYEPGVPVLGCWWAQCCIRDPRASTPFSQDLGGVWDRNRWKVAIISRITRLEKPPRSRTNSSRLFPIEPNRERAAVLEEQRRTVFPFRSFPEVQRPYDACVPEMRPPKCGVQLVSGYRPPQPCMQTGPPHGSTSTISQDKAVSSQ